MTSLPEAGQPFPDFSLDGFDTRAARAGKPILAILWRTGCSTCRYSMPFLDRIFQAYPGAIVVGVSQDTRDETDAYCKENGIAMPQLIDADLKVSRQYGCRTVPTYVLADTEGVVRYSGNSWSQESVEEMSQLLAGMLGTEYRQIVREADQALAFKPG